MKNWRWCSALPGREGVDVAGVPLRSRRDTRIEAAPIGVDVGDNPMEAVLEADVEGVNLIGRDQRAPHGR